MITKILKKIGAAVAALAFTLTTLTSCDSFIASTLEGTWEGDMYFTSYYDGRVYYSNYTELEFIGDPFRMKSGYGYWIDYYSNAPWDYVANHIAWEVYDRVIRIHLLEDDEYVEIFNYALNDSFFTGDVRYAGESRHFKLRHTSSPNWNDYYYGNDGYYGGYDPYDPYDPYYPYYSPAQRGTAAADSIGSAVKKDVKRPERRLRPEGTPVPLAPAE